MRANASTISVSFAVFMGLALTGCIHASDSVEDLEEQTGEAEQALSPTLGGPALYDMDQAVYPFTVRIKVHWSNGTSGICSGAIIGAHTIITAAHCTRNYDTNPPRTPVAATTIYYGPGWTSSQQITSSTERFGWWELTGTDIGLYHVANAIHIDATAISGSSLPVNSSVRMHAMGRMRNDADYVGKYTITSSRNVDDADAEYLYFNGEATDGGDSGGPWIFSHTTNLGRHIVGGVTSGSSEGQDRASKTSRVYSAILAIGSIWGDAIQTYVLPPTGCQVMNPGEGLAHDQSVWSCNGRFELRFQSDSHLVLYKHSAGVTTPIWASGTWGMSGHKLILQEGGNLVMYTTRGEVVWETGTHGNANSRLHVLDNGEVAIYNTNNQPIWSTNTAGM